MINGVGVSCAAPAVATILAVAVNTRARIEFIKLYLRIGGGRQKTSKAGTAGAVALCLEEG
jgi:hypothetical protein